LTNADVVWRFIDAMRRGTRVDKRTSALLTILDLEVYCLNPWVLEVASVGGGLTAPPGPR